MSNADPLKGYEFQYSDLIVAESDIERIAGEKLFSTKAYYLSRVASTLSNSLRKSSCVSESYAFTFLCGTCTAFGV